MNRANSTTRPVFWVSQWWLGLLLLAVCWPLNWTLPGMRTAYLFFPLWLGYILVVDGLVLSRTGTSLWSRSRREFLLLFVTSAPAWWLFEVINRRTGNWEYLGSDTFTVFEYYLLCTISFSTVMPAVFETANLMRSFHWMERFASGPRLKPTLAVNLGLFLGGVAMLDDGPRVAEALLPVRVDVAGADSGAAESMAWPPPLSGGLAAWRLADW